MKTNKTPTNIIKKIPILGHITWLCLQSQAYKHLFISDVEWAFLSPLALDQYKLFVKDGVPLGFVSWANLSGKIEKRLIKENTRLSPLEWNSGNKIFLIDIITPFGGREDMLEDIKNTVLENKKFKYLDIDKQGNRIVKGSFDENA